MNGVRSRRDLSHFTEQLNVRRALVKIIVAHQTAKRLTAELAIFLFIYALEQRTLVPGRTFVLLQRLAHLLLGDVHDTNLEHLVRLGVVHQIVQAAPRPSSC